ncbi:MAG: ABC transporter permease [Victivallales bacterium]|nr:ABC transporter permease [Victivallales bacterium]
MTISTRQSIETASTTSPAEARLVVHEGNAILEISGEWLDYDKCPDWHQLLRQDMPKSIELKDVGITAWNSSLVTFIFNFAAALRGKGCTCKWDSMPKGIVTLLGLAFAVPEKHLVQPHASCGFLSSIGMMTETIWHKTIAVVGFVGMFSAACGLLLVGRSRTKLHDILFQTARCGHHAIFIVSFTCMLIGIILGFIGSIPLRMFGAEIYVSTLVGLGILRMMSATTVGTVMAGRTGAAFAAELGSMQTNEEIDAYTAMGLSPVELLVLPRVLALMFTMPLLCIYGDLMGVIGGMLIGVLYSGIGFSSYFQHLCATTTTHDFIVGIITCWIFGILIGICGCYHGLHCARNSTAVGQATTAAVVSSIICMIIATFIITIITVVLKY